MKRSRSPEQARWQLAALRNRLECLKLTTEAGAILRRAIAVEGSEVWPESEGERWPAWVREHGDETARHYLAAFEADMEGRAEQFGLLPWDEPDEGDAAAEHELQEA